MNATTLVPLLALLALPLPQEPVQRPVQDPPPPEAQDPARIARAIEEVCAQFAARADVDGLSLSIGTAEKPLVARGWGYADAGHARAASAGTQVRLGRLTDIFLAVAAMRLVEQERLDLDAKVSELLPGLAPLAHEVRVHHLLDHTSGLAPYRELPARWEQRGRQGTPAEELLALVPREFLFEPGARHEESNANTTLLALVIEQTAGTGLQAHLRRSILAPAGVYRTAPCDPPAEPATAGEAGATEPEEERATEGVPFPATYSLGLTDVLSTEELCSNAEDLYRFTRALHDGEILEEGSLRRLYEPVRLAGDGRSPHGPLLRRVDHDGLEALVDSGEQTEDRILVAHYLASHLTVVVLAHGATAGREGRVDELRQRLARVALSLPEPGVVDLELEEPLRARLVGGYQFGTTRVEIVARGKGLALVRPRGPDLELLYQGGERFVARGDETTQVVFHLPEDDDAPAERFVLRERGFEQTAVRMD